MQHVISELNWAVLRVVHQVLINIRAEWTGAIRIDPNDENPRFPLTVKTYLGDSYRIRMTMFYQDGHFRAGGDIFIETLNNGTVRSTDVLNIQSYQSPRSIYVLIPID